jgi:hypothetical protein
VCEGLVTGRQNDHHGVCGDRRTPGQKEADKHEAADGKNGGCAYSYDTQGYYCTQRGFVCIDEMACADRRTAEEKAEDKAIEALEEALRQESQRRHKRMNAIVGGIISGLIGVVIGVGTLCWVWRCRRKRREGKPAREQTRRDRERGMELAKVESTRAKKEEKKANLDRELEKALINGITAARPGTCLQRDLVAQLERVRAAPGVSDSSIRRARGDRAGDLNGPPEYTA